MTTKKRLGALTGALIIALLALMLSACGSSDWNKADLTEYDKFGTTVQCDQIDTASETLETAVKDNDGVALTQMGVWIDGKLDEAILKDARDNLNKWRTECPKSTSTVTSTAASSSSASAEDCADGFGVKLQPNNGGDLVDGGLAPQTQEGKDKVAKIAKEDPRVLQVYYNASPLGNPLLGGVPITDAREIAPIENGTCYTEKGRSTYAEWLVVWKLTKVSNDKLPTTGVNTGAVPNGAAFQSEGAIPAGTAYMVVYFDATGKEIGRHWIRIECGNPVSPTPFPGIGGPPPGAPPIVTPPPTGTGGPPPPSLDHKIPSLGSGPRGNAPTGSGHNATPGPGAQIPHTPNPTTPYTPSPAPQPTPVPPNQGGPTPHPTPRPTPPPVETGAPVPSAPETECIPAPGAPC